LPQLPVALLDVPLAYYDTMVRLGAILRHPFAEFIFVAFSRLLVTLPSTWFLYAFVFVIVRCEPSFSFQCLKMAVGAPIGLIVMLGLAVEEKYDEPDCALVWLIAIAVALLWAAIGTMIQTRRRRRS
jgi:hypothetical protein